MSLIQLLILGLIQGISEWLPISSSAHMILFEQFSSIQMYKDPLLNSNYLNLFTVMIQLGSIFAVFLLFKRQLNPFDPRKTKKGQAITYGLWIKVAVACLPTVIVGAFVSRFVDHYFHKAWVIAIMLALYGILFILVENHPHPTRIHKLSQMDIVTALKIGLAQIVSIIPGTSRSGASIMGALLCGVDRKVACEFSFFMSIPIMIGASVLKVVQYAAGVDIKGWLYIIGGCFISFIVSIYAIRFLINYIKNHDFKIFGVYRILLAIVVILSLLF